MTAAQLERIKAKIIQAEAHVNRIDEPTHDGDPRPLLQNGDRYLKTCAANALHEARELLEEILDDARQQPPREAP